MTRNAKPTPKMLDVGDEWLTSFEAAARMKIEVETLYKWAKTGSRGPVSYGNGKMRRYKKSECDAWLQIVVRQTADTIHRE